MRAALVGGLLVAASLAIGCGEEELDPESPNVVIFLLDAARADHFGSYGYERATTPRADAFAAGATRYATAVADASYTFASVAALMTGQPPHRTALLDPTPVPHWLPMLAETARRAGYRTMAYSENPYVTKAFHFDQGFGQFEAAFPFEEFQGRAGELPSFDSTTAIRNALDRVYIPRRPWPFFLYLHLIRPHNPYAPPEPYAGMLGSEERHRHLGGTDALRRLDASRRPVPAARLDRVRTLYDENLLYGDALFGALLDGLAQRDLLERSIVILLSDHGEAFREHGRMLHSTTVYEEMIRIPLIVRVPGVEPGVRREPVQLSDLGAALHRFFREGGRSPSALARLGRGGEVASEPTFSWTIPSSARAAVRTRTHKLVIEPDLRRPVEFFDLVTDPAERAPLAPDVNAVADALHGAFARALDAGPALGVDAGEGREEVDAATLRRLRALGYVEE